MSSIDEKLQTFEQIMGELEEIKKLIAADSTELQSELSSQKSNWNDDQMQRFAGNAYAEKFNSGTSFLVERIDHTIAFLQHKYETLKTHRS